jgi:Xaa-Pro dipeptidase
MLLAGEVTPYRNDTDRELAFRQESNFFYLTGCNVPGSYVVVQGELDGKTPPTVDLYIPEIEEADLMWSIVRPPPKFFVLSSGTYVIPSASSDDRRSSLDA